MVTRNRAAGVTKASRIPKSTKSKNSFATTLKFEVYGIILIAVAIIALSGEKLVGRTLLKVSSLLLGHYHFFLPVIAIYIGISLMIRRNWPSRWTMLASGVTLLLAGLTLYSTIRTMSAMPMPVDGLTNDYIFSTMKDAIMQGFDRAQPYSGGFIGTFLFMAIYSLVGYEGAYFIVFVSFLLAFMLITKLSYVDLIRIVRSRGREFSSIIAHKWTMKAEQREQSKLQRRMEQQANESESVPEEPSLVPTSFAELQRARPQLTVTSAVETFSNLQQNHQPLVDEHSELSPYEQYLLKSEQVHEESKPLAEEVIVQLTPPSKPVQATLFDDDLAPPQVKGSPQGGKQYHLPSLQLLSTPEKATRQTGGSTSVDESRHVLESTLASFGVKASVMNVVRGPAVTRYEIQPASGVKVSKIVGLTDDIALALAAKDIRMEAPIPGKSAIGIEVPNSEVSVVTMREVMDDSSFKHSEDKLSIAFGRDISGQPIVANLAKMPHLLVAGATGSGKSVCVNGIITSILYKSTPDEVKFLMIDPKMVELNMYNGIPHLLAPVVTDPKRASLALKKIVVEMEKRYELFASSGTRNMDGYNAQRIAAGEPPLPYIVVIVDELADLMMVAAGDVEEAIMRIAQMARAAGIHLIIATQRPSVDVITGVIKANIPSRIAFGVSSQIDSRTILDSAGAEKLLGRGDMLFMPVGMSKPLRVQGAFLSDQEVEKVVNHCRSQAKAEYKEDLVPMFDEAELTAGTDEDAGAVDPFFIQCVRTVIEDGKPSASWLQRRFSIGYNRAARLIDEMESRGIISRMESGKQREVLMTYGQFEQSLKSDQAMSHKSEPERE